MIPHEMNDLKIIIRYALKDLYELLGTLTWYSLYELHGTFPTRLALLEARKTRKEMIETCLRKFSIIIDIILKANCFCYYDVVPACESWWC